MPQDTFRIASFNVENLFGRSKVFNFIDKTKGDRILERVDIMRKILKKDSYSATDKKKLVKEFTKGGTRQTDPPLKEFVKVREDQGKLWKRSNYKITGVKASGKLSWSGTIEFKKAKFSDIGRKNTGKVIKNVKADIACIVEADNRISLRKFDTDVLGSRYRYEMLIDGNDNRGIDLGLYSRYELGIIRTHIFDGSSRSKTFSRDCPEYEILLPNGESLFILCNHLKSKGYDTSGTANSRRKRQATAIAELLKKYDLKNDLVVIAGDLNDTPDSAPLKPLMDVRNMYDVLKLQFPRNPEKRWTYHYNSFEQIDYLLVSRPLKDRMVEAGVYRKGMHDLKKMTENSDYVDNEEELDSVTSWANAASDHGAVWADFKL